MITIIILLINITTFFLRKFLLTKFFTTKKTVYFDLMIILLTVSFLAIGYISNIDRSLLILNKSILVVSLIYFLITTPNKIKW